MSSEIILVHTDNAPKAVGPYSQAVKYQGMVFLSGQIAIDPVSNVVMLDKSVAEQAEQCFKNIEAVLLEAGSSRNQVLKVSVFLLDMKDFSDFNTVYEKYFEGHRPARSCVAVKSLPKDVKVEIEVIASY